MNAPIVQIFGHKKCADTRKAERWFKERGMKIQSVDLAQKGLSPGELRSVAARVGGVEGLIDRDIAAHVAGAPLIGNEVVRLTALTGSATGPSEPLPRGIAY